MLKIDCKKKYEECEKDEECKKLCEKIKKMAKKVFFIMLGIGVISVWQYINYKTDKEIDRLRAEKSQLELENLALKKELGEYKELEDYVKKNKKAIELLKQFDNNMKGGN
jgi:cell division protein FtsB